MNRERDRFEEMEPSLEAYHESAPDGEKTELTVHCTPVILHYSYRRRTDPLNKRLGEFFVYRQGKRGVMFGVQGPGFFRALRQALPEIFSSIEVLMGFIPSEHFDKYRKIGLEMRVVSSTIAYPETDPNQVELWVEGRMPWK